MSCMPSGSARVLALQLLLALGKDPEVGDRWHPPAAAEASESAARAETDLGS